MFLSRPRPLSDLSWLPKWNESTLQQVGFDLPRDLLIINNTTNPNYQIDVNWTEGFCTVVDVNGATLQVAAQDLTCDLEVSGENGKMSAAAEAASTWYFLYLIYNPTTDTASLGFHTSEDFATAEADFPSGFTHGRRIHARFNDSGSDFVVYKQYGNEVFYDEWTGQEALNNGSATTPTDVDLSDFMPPTSRIARIFSRLVIDHNTADVAFFASIRENGSSATNGQQASYLITQVANVNIASMESLYVNTDSAQLIEYEVNQAASTDTFYDIYVVGYKDQI